MENQDLEVFDDGEFNNEATGKRSAFITVLAILSWVFVGCCILLNAVYSTVSEEEYEEQMEIAYDESENLGDLRLVTDILSYEEAAYENRKINNIGQLIFLLLEGFAVFMMFKLKRMGFWLYTIAQIGFIGVCFYVFPADNLRATFVLTYYIFIILLFEILYAVNLKHMKA